MNWRPRFSLRSLLLLVLLIGSASMLVWNWAPWVLVHRFDEPFGDGGELCWSPDGRTLGVARDRSVCLYDSQSGKHLILKGDGKFHPMSITFSADGRRLATGDADGTISVWNVDEISRSPTLNDVAASEPKIMKANGENVRCVRFSPDGTRLVSAGTDGCARVWDISNGACLVEMKSSGVFSSAEFSPDGRTIANAGDDRCARIWSAADGSLLHTLRGHRELIYSAIFSADGNDLLTNSGDGTVRHWDARSGQLKYVLSCGQSPIWSSAWSFSQDEVLTINDDGLIQSWSRSTGRKLVEYHVEREDLHHIAVSRNRIAVGGYYCPVTILEAHTLRPLATFDGGRELCFSPDGGALAAIDSGSSVFIWRNQRPEQWWGVATLPGFWLTLLFLPAFVWSLRRDRNDRSTLLSPTPPVPA